MFLVQMNQLWLMSNINPFQCKQYVVTVAAGAFTRLVRKSFFYFNYVAMSVMMLCLFLLFFYFNMIFMYDAFYELMKVIEIFNCLFYLNYER